MIEIVVLVRTATLHAIAEHSENELGGARPINKTESLLLLNRRHDEGNPRTRASQRHPHR
jgi:hypothetical protein